MMKVMIAVPTFENITPDTFKSIYDLDCGEHEHLFEYVRGYDCATARNRIAQISMDSGADYVLMVDNDVTLPQDVLMRMLEDPVEVCLGYYAHRPDNNIYTGSTCICRRERTDGTLYYNYDIESEYTGAELKEMRGQGIRKFRIHGGGMGCALINTEVFRKIRYPWYDWVNYADDNRGILSEDLYFCEQCKFNGIKIYSDTAAGCGHLMRHVQWPE